MPRKPLWHKAFRDIALENCEKFLEKNRIFDDFPLTLLYFLLDVLVFL